MTQLNFLINFKEVTWCNKTLEKTKDTSHVGIKDYGNSHDVHS